MTREERPPSISSGHRFTFPSSVEFLEKSGVTKSSVHGTRSASGIVGNPHKGTYDVHMDGTEKVPYCDTRCTFWSQGLTVFSEHTSSH